MVNGRPQKTSMAEGQGAGKEVRWDIHAAGVSEQYYRKLVFQLRNPKPEIRNESKVANTNAQNRPPPGGFRTLKHWVFELVSGFGFRVSDLCPLRRRHLQDAHSSPA